MTKHIHGGDIYRYRGYMDYSANLNPMGLPGGVREALIEAAGQVEAYPDVECQELIHGLEQYEKTENLHYFCGNGAAEVIFALCLCKKPKRALLLAPTFAEYEQALKTVDAEICYYELQEKRNFIPDNDYLDFVKKSQADMIFFCNPNNPTGVVMPRDYMEELVKICAQKNIFLAVDECFMDFVKEGEEITLKPLIRKYPNLFLVKAFTKRYAMAGVRLGYGISADNTLVTDMKQVIQPWNVSTLAQKAGIAALKEEQYVEQGRQMVFAQRDYLVDNMRRLGLKVYQPEANYIFFRGPADLGARLGEEKILIRNCSNYRGLESGYYRIAVRDPQKNARLIEAIRNIMEKYETEEIQQEKGN